MVFVSLVPDALPLTEILCSARCKAVLARQLGWIPKHEKKWAETFHIELQEYVERPPDPKTLPLVMQKKKTST